MSERTSLFGGGCGRADARWATPGFGVSTEKALRALPAPVLYIASETDLYFPGGDAREESQWIKTVTLAPIPSLWGHPAGPGASPEDPAFIEQKLRAFLAAP